jgi:hypothetical protein
VVSKATRFPAEISNRPFQELSIPLQRDLDSRLIAWFLLLMQSCSSRIIRTGVQLTLDSGQLQWCAVVIAWSHGFALPWPAEQVDE